VNLSASIPTAKPEKRREPSRSFVCCGWCFVAFVFAGLFVSIGSYSTYTDTPGVAASIAAALVGVWAYLVCPVRPRFGKFVCLILAGLNIWLCFDTSASYLSHVSPAFRNLTTSVVSRFISY
jgi:hypothetical protein